MVDSWSVSEAQSLDDYVEDFHVQRGDEGPMVIEVQTLLDNLFGAHLDKDGIFGPLTEQAVREFQDVNRLDVDGVVGPQTSKALQDTASLPIDGSAPSTMPTKVKKKGKGLLIGAGVSGVIGVVAAAVGAKKHNKAAIALGVVGLLTGAGLGVAHVAR